MKENFTVLDSLNHALSRALADDKQVYLLGEDLLDPYGGAFKVTRGLSTAFPDRVITTPVSEAGILGLATGMALRGLRPVVEIMFGDFITLGTDQLVNHAAKFRYIYNDEVKAPLIVRTPMGGRRGYGPTHSQTIEKLFMGVPGLSVVAPTSVGDPGQLLYDVIMNTDDPLLFVENKLLYAVPIMDFTSSQEFILIRREGGGSFSTPTYILTIMGAPSPVLTLAAYGYMVELAREAILRLAYEEEIFAELVVPTRLTPFEIEPILASMHRTGRLLAIEESTLSMGWGSELLARLVEVSSQKIKAVRRVAANDHPLPAASTLESAALPDVETIIRTARDMVRGS